MLSFFPPDILHTMTKGPIEYALGFTLQCVLYISEVDVTFFGAPKKLAATMRSFPGHHSLQPVRHFRFDNVWEWYMSKDSQQKGNPYNSTGLMACREGYKLPAMLMQLMFCCTDRTILPHDFQWCQQHGFEEPYFNPGQAICNALNAVMDVHLYCNAKSLSEMQIVTFQMLISNMQSHLLILDFIRKRLINRGKKSLSEFEDLKMDEFNLLSNAKFEMIRHMPQSKRLSGCVNDVRDTSAGELMMKSVRTIFNSTTKRYETVLAEMLRKSLNLQILRVVRNGVLFRNTSYALLTETKRPSLHHSYCLKIGNSTNYDFTTSYPFKCQKLEKKISLKVEKFPLWVDVDGRDFNVHALLKQV